MYHKIYTLMMYYVIINAGMQYKHNIIIHQEVNIWHIF